MSLTEAEVLRQMEGADEKRLVQLALELACPESVLTTFANSPSVALRAAAARNPRLHLGLLTMLAQSSQEVEAVALAVAEHPSTTPESLQRLSGSLHPSVRIAAALHPSTPLAALLLLADTPDVSVHLALATRANLPAEVQRALLRTGGGEVEVRQALASPLSGSEELLAASATSEDPDARWRVAAQPNLATDPRQVLRTDADWGVRQAAMFISDEAASPHAPVDDQAYLKFLTAEQQQERQDLVQALETLNSEALERARQRWMVVLP